MVTEKTNVLRRKNFSRTYRQMNKLVGQIFYEKGEGQFKDMIRTYRMTFNCVLRIEYYASSLKLASRRNHTRDETISSKNNECSNDSTTTLPRILLKRISTMMINLKLNKVDEAKLREVMK